MNRDFIRLAAKVLLMIPALLVVYIFIFLSGYFIIGSQYQGVYNASIIDKVSRLKAINEPKIILVGHSNLAFGINSPMIQEAMNMPVVNLGLHGGLGNAFHENIAKLNINSGDIVVICHSDFTDDAIQDNFLAWTTIEYHNDLWEILRLKDSCNIARTFPKYWAKSFILWLTRKGNKNPGGSYSRTAFNEYGDVVVKSKLRHYTFKPDSIKVPKINNKCVNRLNEFNSYCRERGAFMLVAGYPIGYGEYTPDKSEYDRFQKELAERLDCEIISDYKDYFIPYEYFYDTIFHLTAEGADIRTAQLIRDLQRWKASH